MSKIEDAAHRLEEAVSRLETAAHKLNADTEKLAGALAQAKENYAALEKTTSQVANRLDQTIEKLNAVLEN